MFLRFASTLNRQSRSGPPTLQGLKESNRGGGFSLGFSLGNEAFGGIDADDRGATALGLTELGMQLRRVHGRQHPSYRDEIALTD